MNSAELTEDFTLPSWLPNAVRLYLDHTEAGQSLRALARREGCHASTVMRHVRRYENRRDDPLMDEALATLGRGQDRNIKNQSNKENERMTLPLRADALAMDETTLAREGLRILRRLTEPGAVLAIAPDMEKAVVMREFADGRAARTGVVERMVAQAFVLKDWIACRKPGRVATYEITSVGRSALRRMTEEDARAHGGMAEATTSFTGQDHAWDTRAVQGDDGPRRMRYNMAESPVALLGRRRDKDGKLFLEPDLVVAAERLREDFELAQMGPRVAQNWDRFLTGGDKGSYRSEAEGAEGPRAARDRVAAALRDLGPGLGDMVLRCCCYLEGLEVAEKRMGWSARSGKIVLRIALQRLRRHYDEAYGRSGPLIG
jgi:transposase-like protein